MLVDYVILVSEVLYHDRYSNINHTSISTHLSTHTTSHTFLTKSYSRPELAINTRPALAITRGGAALYLRWTHWGVQLASRR